ncbi:MAG TPA: OmpA family protein [Smithella sp.]|nr:OmpA family protein [Smithella sp.]
MIRKFISVAFFIVLLITGCVHQTTVVLVPDREGHVGKVAVQNQGGEQLLSESGKAVVVWNEIISPRPAVAYDDQKINATFGSALAIEPPPQKFILYFENDSTEIVEASKPLIPEVIESIKQRNSFDISVNGHSDSTGTAEYNLDLSLKRAVHMKDILVGAGINEQYISTTSHGEGNPLIPTKKGVAEPRNRRVEIIVR